MLERRAFMMSVTLSVLAMYLVYQYVAKEEERLNDQYGVFFPMVIASKDILQFESIRPTDIETIRVPKAMVPPGLIRDPASVIDAVAAVPISRGEQILDNKIISKNVYSGLDTQVSLGKRAISVPVNVKSSVGYMIRPGNRVDLGAFFEYKEGKTNVNEVKVFMQDVLVLASGTTIQSDPPRGVDQSIRRALAEDPSGTQDEREIEEVLSVAKQDSTYQTVTLEVTPEQAQVIVYVLSVFADNILLMLRNSDDRKLDRRTTTNLRDVMGPDSYLVKGKKRPPPRLVPRPKFYDYRGLSRIPVQ
jgi:pilus assembly protein CpaB